MTTKRIALTILPEHAHYSDYLNDAATGDLNKYLSDGWYVENQIVLPVNRTGNNDYTSIACAIVIMRKDLADV